MVLPASVERVSVGVRVILLVDELRLDVVLPAHVALAETDAEIRELAARAGARVAPEVEVVKVGHGSLDPDLPLAAQGVGDGDLLSLQAPDVPVALRLHHDLAEAVADVVGRVHLQVGPALRARAAQVLSGLFACLAALLAPAAGTIGLLVTALTSGGAGVLLHRTRWRPGVGPAQVVLVVVLVVNVASWATCAQARWGRDWPPGSVFLLSSVLVAGALLVAASGVREWAAAPLLLAVPWGVLPLILGTFPAGHPVTLDAARGALVVLLVLGAGHVARAVVGAVLVRPTRVGSVSGEAGHGQGERGAPRPSPWEPLRPEDVQSRVTSATGVVLAVDVATAVIAVAVVPAAVLGAPGDTGTPWAGVAFWLALVGTLVLRTCGERLVVRAVTGWVGGASVLLVGTFHLWAGAGADGGTLARTLCALACVAALVSAAAVAAGSPAGVRRATVVLDVALRLSLPSLWLVSSGVLG